MAKCRREYTKRVGLLEWSEPVLDFGCCLVYTLYGRVLSPAILIHSSAHPRRAFEGLSPSNFPAFQRALPLVGGLKSLSSSVAKDILQRKTIWVGGWGKIRRYWWIDHEKIGGQP